MPRTFKSYLLTGASLPVLVWAAPVWPAPVQEVSQDEINAGGTSC